MGTIPCSSCTILPLLLALLLAQKSFAAPASASDESGAIITVDASPATLKHSGDNVTVKLTWSVNAYGSRSASAVLDWLGIYSPHDSPHQNFIGYLFLYSFCSDWVQGNVSQGSCSVEFPVLNLRGAYQFRVFRWDRSEIDASTPLDEDHNPIPAAHHFLGESKTLNFSNWNYPEQIHLAFTHDPAEMRVMFVTRDDVRSYVRFGLSEENLPNVAKALSETYTRDQMCDSPANTSLGWRNPGFIHDALMHGLKPATRYFYQVGSDEGGWSTIQSFVSADVNSDETIAFLFGDMGTSVPFRTYLWTQEESKLTMKWIQRDLQEIGDRPTFISHIGDISYARGYSWIWDSFFAQIEPVASTVPYHVCIGNHEYDWPLQPWKPEWATMYGTDGGGECGVPYSLRFHMPGNSSFPTGTSAPPTRNLYYSFDLGVVHFLYMSTETNFLRGSDQYAFIEDDLRRVDRKKTPFVVFQGHRPMYTTNYELGDAALRSRLMDHIEPLLVKYGVNLVLWGHVHKYERFCPLNNFSCGSNSNRVDLPIHVVIGMAGQDWQPKWEPRPDHIKDPIFPQPLRSLYRSSEFGYTRLHATSETLTLSYIGNHDGEVHDVLEIHLNSVKSDYHTETPYLKTAGIFMVGILLGFLAGKFFKLKKKEVQWTVLKTTEV